MQSCFAASSQVVCVAEDTAVSFYAAKSLKKFRVERLNGSRVCGLHIQVVSSSKAVLHVLDAEGSWFQFSLDGGTPTLAKVSSIQLPSVAVPPTTSPSVPQPTSADNEEADIVAHATGSSDAVPAESKLAEATKSSTTPAVVLAANFHTQQAQLYAVLLTSTTVLEVALTAAATVSATVVHTFHQPQPQVLLAVGLTSGHIVVAVPQAREFFFSLFSDRLAAHQQRGAAAAAVCPPLQPRAANIGIQSIACSPVNTAVAVGGSRGELLVFVEVQVAHCFSDHWHHTPLTALTFAADGNAVYTGGREAVLLAWDMVSYSHQKIRCDLGALQAITPLADAGAQLLVSCGTSTLAMVDLLRRRVTASVEGIEWAAGGVCTGLVVEQWRGQPAVILTGMPNVLRICDPYTQQSVYSLHVSSQMEAIPSPPRHGIQFVGMLNDSRSLVTYESFSATVLPPLLRFWEYDTRCKQHVETQTVYSPHRSDVVALEVDKRGRRVFTLSSEAVKCWAQTAFTAQNAYGTAAGQWHNHSTIVTPSDAVQTMALSADGSLCFVADDCLHVYSVKACEPGEPWPLLRLLPQYTETTPLRHVVVAPDGCHVVAAGVHQLFFWALDGVAEEPAVFAARKTRVTALCAFSDNTVVAALADCSLVELRCCGSRTSESVGPQLGQVVRRIRHASRFPLRHIAPLHLNSQRLAVVDAVTGFKILHLPSNGTQTTTYEWSGEQQADGEVEGSKRATPNLAAAGPDNGAAQLQLQSFFKNMTPIQDAYENEMAAGQEGSLLTAQQAAQSDKWLAEVLGEPAYTVPPMSSILSMYLQRRS